MWELLVGGCWERDRRENWKGRIGIIINTLTSLIKGGWVYWIGAMAREVLGLLGVPMAAAGTAGTASGRLRAWGWGSTCVRGEVGFRVGVGRSVSQQGLWRVVCAAGHVRRGEWRKRTHHDGQASKLSSSNRRILLLSLTLGLPLAHALVVGGAKAVSFVEAKRLESGGAEAESPVKVFGFDGLGKASEEYVPGKIVALAQAGDGAVLFLGVDGFELPLQLVVGPAEAMAVLTAVQERKTRRPVTHEAWGLSLAAVGWKVDRVAITSNESDVFYSRVILSKPSEAMKSIDVRPSDGIALALRCRAPLYVLRKVAQDILVSPKLDQGDKRKVDPLKRPSLQANNKSAYVDNSLARTTPENSSDPLLFMDDGVSELLGTSVKVFI